MFEFELLAKNKKNKARVGEFLTPHGTLTTPELAFVATEAEIKAIPRDILPKLPVRLVIANTFHIWVKNILKHIEKKEGIHRHMNYKNVAMSDSGGFQVFSMGFGKAHNVGKIGGMFPGKNYKPDDKNNPLTILEEGVEFIFNGQKILLTPEKSMEIQQKIGADIMFAFDECTSPLNSKAYTKKAMERTHRWMKRCIKVWKIGIEAGQEKRSRKLDKKNLSSNFSLPNPFLNLTSTFHPQALFAIVQGGYFKDLRKISAIFMAKQNVSGFGIGGSLGTTEDEVRDVLEWTIPYLPEEKPRHLLGIGRVKDIFDGVERGVDLFDCVIPTREARHKVLYTKKGKINVRKYRTVDEVVDKHCGCQMCASNVTMKQLNNLFTRKDPRAFFFATVHNIQFYADLMKEIREAIPKNRFLKLKESYLQYY